MSKVANFGVRQDGSVQLGVTRWVDEGTYSTEMDEATARALYDKLKSIFEPELVNLPNGWRPLFHRGFHAGYEVPSPNLNQRDEWDFVFIDDLDGNLDHP